MLRQDLHFDYPEELVALERAQQSRVLRIQGSQAPQELTVPELLASIPPGDVFVVNETKVLPRRIFTNDFEILFLNPVSPLEWQVLFPAKNCKVGQQISLPGNRLARLQEKGRPQTLGIDQELTPEYFVEYGELPLPPYIQKARGDRHERPEDKTNYQTDWAKNAGSLAAPTASFHITKEQLNELQSRGVQVLRLTLHVGLGTFLPITSDNLNDHVMHEEVVEIPMATWREVQMARKQNRGVWALGTTVARSLEAAARGHLQEKTLAKGQEVLLGSTRLFMKPGSEWLIVNRLLTNFHQPESTLLALVASFAGLEKVKSVYKHAIEKKFRLFSYGDLTAWIP